MLAQPRAPRVGEPRLGARAAEEVAGGAAGEERAVIEGVGAGAADADDGAPRADQLDKGQKVPPVEAAVVQRLGRAVGREDAADAGGEEALKKPAQHQRVGDVGHLHLVEA